MSLFMHFVHLSRGGSLYVCHPVVGTIGGIGIRERKKGWKDKRINMAIVKSFLHIFGVTLR